MEQLQVKIEGNIAFIEGALTRHTVGQYNTKSITLLLQQKSVNMNFSKVSKVDTAGVAWLLLIVEQASKTACELSFTHLPEDLLNLTKLSGVTEFLPIIELS